MTSVSIVDNFDFFNELTPNQKQELASISRVISYPEGSILYYENDLLNDLLFLVDGLIKVYKVDKFENEIFLYHVYKNDMISELSSVLVDGIFCYSNAEFKEDSKILAVNYKEFKKHFLHKNLLTIKFIEELAKKSQKLQCIINRELVFDSTAKVAYMLCNDLRMFNDLKRTEISFMLHIQPETLSRVLNKLKRSEIIDMQNQDIIILNKSQLESMYKGIEI